MTDHTNNLYMEQVINESGIKENITMDTNYGGYETETHY